MTLPASIDLATTFQLASAPYKFNLKNLTDFTDEGITLTNVKGNFKIVNPAGTVVWDNQSTVTPDLFSFSITGITRSSQTATATTSTNHNLETGDWAMIAGAGQGEYNGLFQITKLTTTSFSYTVTGSPATPATGTILGLKMSLNTIAIPVDAVTGMPLLGQYTITLTTIVAGGVQAGTYTTVFQYNNTYVRPSVDIRQSLNCTLPSFISTDNTTYMQQGIQPTVTRSHLINFPAASGISQESFVTQTVTIYAPKVWNGVYTSTIASLISYTFTDDLIISDRVTASKTFTASCDINLCKINCCLNELNQNYQNAAGKNDFQAGKYLEKLGRAIQLQTLYVNNINCGNDTEAQNNLQEIYNVTGCTGDCGCDSESGQIIPYTGFIGKTILEYDAQVANSQGDYVNYNGYIFKLSTNSQVGQNPVNTPNIFLPVGLHQHDFNSLREYAVGDQFWFEKQLFRVLTATTSGQTPITHRTKFQYVGGGINSANIGNNVGNTLTLNYNSGVVEFAGVGPVPGGGTISITLNNPTFSPGNDVELYFRSVNDGGAVVEDAVISNGTAVVYIFNPEGDGTFEGSLYVNNRS